MVVDPFTLETSDDLEGLSFHKDNERMRGNATITWSQGSQGQQHVIDLGPDAPSTHLLAVCGAGNLTIMPHGGGWIFVGVYHADPRSSSKANCDNQFVAEPDENGWNPPPEPI